MTTRTKVLTIASLLSILALSLGYQLGDRFGLFVGLILALSFLGFFFLQGDDHILEFYYARPLSGQDPWKFLELVDTIAKAEKLATPDIYIFEHPHFSVFSYWPFLSQARICFSTGALEKLKDDDLRHLVIHQILFLKNTNSARFQFTYRFCRSIVSLGRALDFAIPAKLWRRKQALFFERGFGFFAELLMDLVYNEKIYQEADQLTAQRTQAREIMGELLWRLKGVNETLPLQLQPCTRQLFFLDPVISQNRFRKRVQKLVGYFPI